MYWTLLWRNIVVGKNKSDRFTVEYYWNIYERDEKIKILLNKRTFGIISVVIGLYGSNARSKEERNKFNNWINKLIHSNI
jgi:hypothetical protein